MRFLRYADPAPIPPVPGPDLLDSIRFELTQLRSELAQFRAAITAELAWSGENRRNMETVIADLDTRLSALTDIVGRATGAHR